MGHSTMSNPKCVVCSKTAYPLETVRYQENAYHKLCFRCQEEGCGTSLTLKGANGVGSKDFCNKHKPVDKPTATTVEGSMSLSNAKAAHANAQTLVSNEQRAAPGCDKNLQVADMATTNAKNAPKVATVNDQVRAGAGERNAQVADLTTSNAQNAPKNSTVNDQIRGGGERNAQNFY